MSNPPTSPPASLAREIVEQIDELLRDAETQQQPLEIEPYRARLFELFVSAEGAGYLSEESAHDLSADGLCRMLAERWGLRDATQASFDQQTRLPPGQVAKMRMLWSLMRMWMEWTYAWSRWEEFHRSTSSSD